MIPNFPDDKETEKSVAENDAEETALGHAEINDERDVTLIELEGEQYEIIDSVILDEKMYIAILPYSEEMPDEDETAEFTILEVVDDPDDEDNCTLKTVDDDELYTRIGDEFLRRFESDQEAEE